VTDLCVVAFPQSNYPAIALRPHQPLGQHLTIHNSPVLFGCRTGICGTCLVKVLGTIPPPEMEEQEVLAVLVPDSLSGLVAGSATPNQPQPRLACQIDLTADLLIWRFEG
jgi:ferredoxin